MKTSEYQKWIAYPPEKSERHAQMLLYLTHSLCDSFFHRLGGVKQESIGLIHRTMRRGAEKTKGGSQKGNSLWTQFLFEDETFRSLLAKFPSGPLFKTLDLIREESEEDQLIPFDPVAQHNFPFKLYQIEQKGQLTSLLHIPSPTRQSLIQKAEIIDEFRGTLRSYQMAKPSRRHLMINLQDRTGWKESARAHALEGLQKNAEFSSVFASFTLPKATPFYYQSHGYENMNQASAFLDAFHGVLDRAESNGFSLPTSFKQTELTRFADTALPFIHKYFFDQKNTLTRRQREDFIEIFYHLLTLKLIDKLEPDSVSFTCKDGMDIGAACEASLFAFIKLLTGGMEEKSEQDYFRWVLYTPALFNRERAIDPERFNRMLAALEQIDSALIDNRKQIVQGINELFGPQFLKSLKLTH